MTKCKKDDMLLHQKRFFITSKGLFRHLTIKRSLKTFITEYIHKAKIHFYTDEKLFELYYTTGQIRFP